MSPARKFLVAICLSLISAGISWRLASPKVLTDFNLAAQEPAPKSAFPSIQGSSASASEDPDLPYRRAAAKCETQALWKWLEKCSGARGTDSVTDELVDRLGTAALDRALEADADHRRNLSEDILSALSRKDAFKALDLYAAHVGEFDRFWAQGCVLDALSTGCGISADKTIEALKAAPGGVAGVTYNITFAPDFDFSALVHYGFSKPGDPLDALPEVLPKWAGYAPAEASRWLVEQDSPAKLAARPDELRESIRQQRPDISEELLQNQVDYMLRNEEAKRSSQIFEFLQAVAASGKADRAEGLTALTGLPENLLHQAWQQLGESSAKSDVDPVVLDSATTMHSRETFLTAALLKSRLGGEPDNSWSEISTQERSQVLSGALAQWQAEDSSPLADQIRTRWEEKVKAAWAKNAGSP